MHTVELLRDWFGSIKMHNYYGYSKAVLEVLAAKWLRKKTCVCVRVRVYRGADGAKRYQWVRLHERVHGSSLCWSCNFFCKFEMISK